MRIGLISDTHNYLHPKLFSFFQDVDEIWHAGDIGSVDTADKLEKFRTLRAVYGNIDGQDVRLIYPKYQFFKCEEVKVFMVHIGGYPNRYEKGIRQILTEKKPGLFISGHSHILKIINDDNLNLLHINPGAAGKNGLHKHITFVRFQISHERIHDLEIMEIERIRE